MKLVINRCYGGFGLSPQAVKRLAELQGKPCYFFQNARMNGTLDLNKLVPVSIEEIGTSLFWFAYSVPDPDKVIPSTENWLKLSLEERKEVNHQTDAISLDTRPYNRTDPLLLQVVEELGSKVASGRCSQLEIVEIPDGTDYVITEYDGLESVEEAHRSWP